MTLLARLTGRMSSADRDLWEGCFTLGDLGDATALWLEGRIASQPGYAAGHGPDPETTDLIPTLAALNRAGFVTDSSQPGVPLCPGYDGAMWQQRAAVSGYTDTHTLTRLRQALTSTRFEVLADTARTSWFSKASDGATVTTRDGQPHTVFGRPIARSEINWLYEQCHPHMRRVLCGSWQVTIVDPQWGANDLWPHLARFAGAVR